MIYVYSFVSQTIWYIDLTNIFLIAVLLLKSNATIWMKAIGNQKGKEKAKQNPFTLSQCILTY